MFNRLDKIPYTPLIIIALFLFLAPFTPMPHVFEKFILLKNGMLSKPIDILDLIYHLLPIGLLVVKILRDAMR